MMFCLYILSTLCCYVVLAQVVPYQEKYFEQNVDHFSFTQNKTFQQRYLIQDKWWDKRNGPIFFYAGNEGDIASFWANTGFMFDIAPTFKALILFMEHRYYGKSLPFGPQQSFRQPYIGYLSTEQALADYAVFIENFKKSQKLDNPVVAFGGSYGGMLAAYMRFKYPNVVCGALAASAPIYLISGDVPSEFFFEDVTKDFEDAGCAQDIREAFKQMETLSKTGKPGYHQLSKIFNLCSELSSHDDYYHLLGWIRNSFTSLAMMDYPYPTSFLAPLPAYPVKEACRLMKAAPNVLQGLATSAALFYGTSHCHDIYKEFMACADPTGCGDSLSWDFQACTEMLMPGGTNNRTDMFPIMPFTIKDREDYCKKTWGVTPDQKWVKASLWGNDIKTASNIVFSNGDLDPWHRGGVIKNISDSVVAIMIEGGAHHLDLRSSNPADPQSVRDARLTEILHIKRWIKA